MMLSSLVYSGLSQDLPKATVTVESPEEPFYPGDTVTLRCYITQYTDWEYYYWYRDNTHIPSKTSKTITISLPTESGQYVCSGWRRTRPQNSSSSQAVTVSYQDLPKATVTVESPEEPFYPGDTVTLRCYITQYTDWEYYWYRDNTRIPSKTSKTITISLPTESGQYVCSGQRKTFPPYSASSQAVTVSYQAALPTPALTVDPQNLVFTGEKVTLKCEVKPSSGWRYKWYKEESSNVFQSEGNTFIITAASGSDEGRYWCRGEREHSNTNTPKSKDVHLYVKAPPTATLTVAPQSPVFTGEKVTLKCEVKPSSGWRYKWYKEQSSNVDFQSEGNTFIITAASGSDEGRYWCRGEREHSNTNTPTSRDVYLSVKALPTATLTVASQSPVWTGDTVTLRCEVTSLTGWRYKWYKGRSQTAVSQSDRYNRTGDTLTIRGAAESDQDQYWCQGERDTRPTSSLINSQSLYLLEVGIRLGLGAAILFAIVVVMLWSCYNYVRCTFTCSRAR
ncbi:Fc receptor-like protein 5 isoform X2 [Denticeps clupeoides]|uniref:Fc receptor-like protein 5 isoform X2 n=1 Tax=Denticeps clupeoides TaxID=299321 RepID=UPI0010A45914|nr:Fc receptor-like protein 5 isoform X2 [Denticeps clupeoides]